MSIAMKHRARLLTVLASAVFAVLPLAPAHAVSASAWTREDPSFPFRWNPCQPIPYRVNLGGGSRRDPLPRPTAACAWRR